MEETKEYAETHYFGLKYLTEFSSRVKLSEFWEDYAFHVIANAGKKPEERTPFLSSKFTDSVSNLTEIIGALSLLDIDFTSIEHGFKTLEGRSAEIKAASNCIIFKKEVKETEGNLQNNILVAQKYFNYGERNQERDKKIEEFLVNEIYGCQVILTNISSKKQEFEVLMEIPEGSLPLGKTPYQKSHSISLNSYSTTTKEFFFYFPNPGKFVHFPSNVSIDSIVVAKSAVNVLNVVPVKTKISDENFLDVLSAGSYADILSFIEKKNILNQKLGFDFSLIYWLLKDKGFFMDLISILKAKKVFNSRVWSYSIYHHVPSLISEYLFSSKFLKKQIGANFKSSLVSITPSDLDIRHLDYYPFVNSRAHKISIQAQNTSGIRNKNLKYTYHALILSLMEKSSLSNTDFLCLSYYLTLQDRISEAFQVFTRINPSADDITFNFKLQYDYMTAYLDFFKGFPHFEKARNIVQIYEQYPVISWRLMFQDMREQLMEYDGKEVVYAEEESKEVKKKKAIQKEPQMSFQLVGKEIHVDCENVSKLILKYYNIDLEILFSRTPFLMQSTEDFSYVQPNLTTTIAVQKGDKLVKIPIPPEFETKNAVIEITADGIKKFHTYFSNSLKVQIIENFGEVKVTDNEGKALPKIYVKTFAKTKSGDVSFYKDGYTDIRGRFDYVSLNTSNLNNVSKFALFIMSPDFGKL